MAKAGSRKAIEEGLANRAAVRAYFASHLCATQRDCSLDLGMDEGVVLRHFRAIRAEWCPRSNPKDAAAADDLRSSRA